MEEEETKDSFEAGVVVHAGLFELSKISSTGGLGGNTGLLSPLENPQQWEEEPTALDEAHPVPQDPDPT